MDSLRSGEEAVSRLYGKARNNFIIFGHFTHYLVAVLMNIRWQNAENISYINEVF